MANILPDDYWVQFKETMKEAFCMSPSIFVSSISISDQPAFDCSVPNHVILRVPIVYSNQFFAFFKKEGLVQNVIHEGVYVLSICT